jgi:hypothetical protein
VIATVAQLVAALLILAAFACAQYRRLIPDSPVYLVLNLVGSTVLAVLAGLGGQYGFLLLNVVWAVVSVRSLVRLVRGRRPTHTG